MKIALTLLLPSLASPTSREFLCMHSHLNSSTIHRPHDPTVPLFRPARLAAPHGVRPPTCHSRPAPATSNGRERLTLTKNTLPVAFLRAVILPTTKPPILFTLDAQSPAERHIRVRSPRQRQSSADPRLSASWPFRTTHWRLEIDVIVPSANGTTTCDESACFSVPFDGSGGDEMVEHFHAASWSVQQVAIWM